MLDKTRCAAILRFTQNAAKLHQRQRFSRIDYPCTRLLRLQGRRGGAITEAVDDFLRPLVARAQERGESAKREPGTLSRKWSAVQAASTCAAKSQSWPLSWTSRRMELIPRVRVRRPVAERRLKPPRSKCSWQRL